MAEGKRVFLTGGGSGMGRHMTGVFARRGDRVFAVDVNYESLEAAAEQEKWPTDRVTFKRLDVRDWTAWNQVYPEAIDRLGGIDVHINFAGLLMSRFTLDLDPEHIGLQIDVNVKGLIFGTQLAAKHMVERPQGGHIINIASTAGLCAVPGLGVYCASKFAARAFSLAAATELRDKNVYVTAICPNTVATPMADRQMNEKPAALMFSYSRLLTVQEIEQAIINNALVRRPIEISLPAGQGWFCKLINLFPGVGGRLRASYEARGKKHQEALLAEKR